MLRALQDEDGRFSDINPQNMQWYSDILAKALRDKAETEVRGEAEVKECVIVYRLLLLRLGWFLCFVTVW